METSCIFAPWTIRRQWDRPQLFAAIHTPTGWALPDSIGMILFRFRARGGRHPAYLAQIHAMGIQLSAAEVWLPETATQNGT